MNNGKYEQPDLPRLSEKDCGNSENNKEKIDTKKNLQKPDDGLSFNCEICMDREGGCPTCGWGNNLE